MILDVTVSTAVKSRGERVRVSVATLEDGVG